MDRPVIIGMGSKSVHNPPGVPVLRNLQSLIADVFPHRGCIINGYGENLGPSSTKFWTPSNQAPTSHSYSVADWILAGNVWIDYCGWPMYRYVTTLGAITTVGKSGFEQFAEAIGYPTLADASFDVGTGDNYLFGTYPFGRGLRLVGSVDGIYLNTNTFQERTFPDPLLRTWQLTSGGYTACFALHPAGGGYYFYATEFPGPADYVKGSPGIVPAATYAQFITAVMRNQVNDGSGVLYTPIADIHNQFHPKPPKYTVRTFNRNGNLTCGAGTHWNGTQCELDTPGPSSSTPPAKSGKSITTLTPTIPAPTTPWYDRSKVRTGLIIGGFTLAGLGLAVGTKKLLENRRTYDDEPHQQS